MMEAVYSNRAPKPIGPYSQAISVTISPTRSSKLLFISGQIPIDPSTGEVMRGDFKGAARRAIENLKAIVEAAGGTLRDVVKVTVFLRDIGRFSEFNSVYEEYFKDPYPARSVIEVSKLPRDADLEIEAIACIVE